jgi:hypothetical protein
MRYVDFRDVIWKELRQSADGLTWADLQKRLDLPYDRPCPTWVRRMEQEIGLLRASGSGRAHVWKLSQRKRNKRLERT